jgi:hypothetical protein
MVVQVIRLGSPAGNKERTTMIIFYRLIFATLVFLSVGFVPSLGIAEKSCFSPNDSWGMIEGCYKKDKLVETKKGNVYFWRLWDEVRKEHGGKISEVSAAALVLERDNNKNNLIKAYCPDYCWAMGNTDPLPQIGALQDGNKYAIWAPGKRLSNRHGTEGYIEIFDADTFKFSRLSKKLNSHHSKKNPMVGVAKVHDCTYLVFSAIALYTSANSNTTPGGYSLVESPVLQSLTPRCSSIGYDALENPDDGDLDLVKEVEGELTWLVKY